MTIEIHKIEGKPQSVTMSYDDYQDLIANQEDLADVAEARARIAAGEQTTPHDVVKAQIDGTHPIKAWRDYRGHTQQQLVDLMPEDTRIGRVFLAEIETRKKKGTTATLILISQALEVDLNKIVEG